MTGYRLLLNDLELLLKLNSVICDSYHNPTNNQWVILFYIIIFKIYLYTQICRIYLYLNIVYDNYLTPLDPIINRYVSNTLLIYHSYIDIKYT